MTPFKKEYPILFPRSFENDLRSGKKIETRRPVRYAEKPAGLRFNGSKVNHAEPGYHYLNFWTTGGLLYQTDMVRCPFGQVGGKLYVRWNYSVTKADADLWLKITGVRVEKLAEIDDAGAICEGFSGWYQFLEEYGRRYNLSGDAYKMVLEQPVWVVQFEVTDNNGDEHV